MSRKSHTIKELKALKFLLDGQLRRAKKVDKNVCMIPDQVDKPDFGFVMKGIRIGIEVCSIDNSKLLESRNVHNSSKPNNAKRKKINAILNGKPYTSVNQTTSIKRDAWEGVLLKKFNLHAGYENFKEVFLLLHTESYSDVSLSEATRFHLNHFCIDKGCPFDKVYLVDLKNKKYIGKVFDKKSNKRLTIPKKLENLESETEVSQWVPNGQPVNMWNTYK
ncbi:hypothetical protein ACLD9W_02525 [Neisseria sp. WLZKY-1]|uniref:hypothetical protein n=1 Tax=Neisseria sp. WLZKY-1 TaxID=3390377 RepID=UPI0039785BC6